jgi:hypothetical protein
MAPGNTRRRDRSTGLALLLSLWVLALGRSWAPGQEPRKTAEPGKAAGVFDDDRSSAKPQEKAKSQDGSVSDRDTIGFTQENAAAQMTELEERMFRLSEALRSLEPENASRLRLALKFSREELILQQMRETNGLLKEAQLAKAEAEVRELVAKLEHLRNLLLAENLDFQLKLARLRQMRETTGQLERIIQEERRELKWSRSATEDQKKLEQLAKRKPDLEALVRAQEAVVADTRVRAREGDNAARKDTLTALRMRETAIRETAKTLATDPLFADLQPPLLLQADPHLGDALTHLEAGETDPAIGDEQAALELFRQELSRLNERTAELERAIAQAEFQRQQANQARNRAATNTLSTVSSRLGDAGIALQKDLIKASVSMELAERDLSQVEADPAASDQSAALASLTKGGASLAQAQERLLVELRTELQARLIAELTEMHDIQTSLRETTEAQAPRAAQKSRTALIALAGLAKTEVELAERTEQLQALVEETEFGIALPTALRVLAREMRIVDGWLKDGDASPRTVTLEKRIEDDLLGLLQAIRRLPPSTPPPPGSPLPSDLRERERELNRLVAELKMIRLLQSRLNDDTVDLDKSRPELPTLPPEVQEEIQKLELSQEEIQKSLARIAERVEGSSDQP